jgi:hypothetical protein
MLVYDDSFVAVMTATQDEATRLGARAYGSEHVLLGLLASDVALSAEVLRAFPQLTADVVRAAVHGAVDDAPHLSRLGINADDVVPAGVRRTGSAVPPRNKHTAELQGALNTASAKWGHLRQVQALPRERTLSSAVLWLAVLEPAARSSRLLSALGVDAESVRPVVLAALLPDGAAVPGWPAHPPVGRVTRLVQRVLSRTNSAR